jgi:hypothetical protein
MDPVGHKIQPEHLDFKFKDGMFSMFLPSLKVVFCGLSVPICFTPWATKWLIQTFQIIESAGSRYESIQAKSPSIAQFNAYEAASMTAQCTQGNKLQSQLLA